MKRSAWMWIVLTALAAGAVLRFYRMDAVGLFAYDEAYFSEIVKTWRAAIQYFAASATGHAPAASLGAYLLDQGGQYYTAAKPTFVLMGTLGSFIIGLHEWTLPVVSAVAGLLTIGVIAVITNRLAASAERSERSALRGSQLPLRAAAFAALALAVSCYHVIYSRSGFSLAVATAFLWAAVMLYRSASSGWRLWWSGACVGLAYTSHTSLYWVPPLVWAATLLSGPAESRLRRLVTVSAGMAAPLLAWEGATRAAQWYVLQHPQWTEAIRGLTGEGRYLSYLQELVMQKQVYGGAEPSTNPWAFYGGLLWDFERPVVLSLAVIGLAASVRRLGSVHDDGTWLLVLGCALAPWALFGFVPHYPVARVCVPAIPALAILCGLGADRLLAVADALGSRPKILANSPRASTAGLWAAAGVAASIVLAGAPRSWHVAQARSGFRQAIAFMREHEGVKHLSSNEHLSRFYVGRANATDLHVSLRGADDPTGKRHIALDQLDEYYRRGYRYVLLDGFRHRLRHELAQAARDIKPVFTAPHSTRSERYLYDIRSQYRDAILASPEGVDVYRLDELIALVRGGPA